MNDLSLPHQLMLLSLHPRKGHVVNNQLDTTLAGALLVSLAHRGKIQVDGKKQVQVIDSRPTGVELLDAALSEIDRDPKTRKVQSWLNRLPSKLKPLKHRTADLLVHRGLLLREGRKVLWIFPGTWYPPADSSLRDELVRRVRATVTGDAPAEPDPAALALLLHAGDCLRRLLEKDERKGLGRRMKQLARSEELAGDVGETIQAMQAAILAATTAATTVAITSGSN